MAAVATFNGMPEWVKIRKGIEGSRMISGLKVESISTAGADLTFNFAGRPDQLAADLRARGLTLRGVEIAALDHSRSHPRNDVRLFLEDVNSFSTFRGSRSSPAAADRGRQFLGVQRWRPSGVGATGRNSNWR